MHLPRVGPDPQATRTYSSALVGVTVSCSHWAQWGSVWEFLTVAHTSSRHYFRLIVHSVVYPGMEASWVRGGGCLQGSLLPVVDLLS